MTIVLELALVYGVIIACGGGRVGHKIYKKIKANRRTKRELEKKIELERRRMKKYIQRYSEIEMTSKRSDDICVICQDDFKEDNKRAKLFCGHKFHTCCIKEWMNHKMTCPLCNMELKQNPNKKKKAIEEIVQ